MKAGTPKGEENPGRWEGLRALAGTMGSRKIQGQGPALAIPSILFLNCFFNKIRVMVIISVLHASENYCDDKMK